jgi:hypothetical protein
MLLLFLPHRQAWDVIFSDPNLSEQSLQQRGITGTVCEKGLRSVCWKVSIFFLDSSVKYGMNHDERTLSFYTGLFGLLAKLECLYLVCDTTE